MFDCFILGHCIILIHNRPFKLFLVRKILGNQPIIFPSFLSSRHTVNSRQTPVCLSVCLSATIINELLKSKSIDKPPRLYLPTRDFDLIEETEF